MAHLKKNIASGSIVMYQSMNTENKKSQKEVQFKKVRWYFLAGVKFLSLRARALFHPYPNMFPFHRLEKHFFL